MNKEYLEKLLISLLSLYLAGCASYILFGFWTTYDIIQSSFLKILFTIVGFIVIPLLFLFLKERFEKSVKDWGKVQLMWNVLIFVFIICFTLSLMIKGVL